MRVGIPHKNLEMVSIHLKSDKNVTICEFMIKYLVSKNLF